MAGHTKLPWEVVGASHVVSFGKAGGNICSMSSPRRERSVEYHASKIGDKDFREACANAEFIVRAVNCHDDLLAACKAFVEPWNRGGDWESNITYETYNNARKAIAKAESANA